MGKFMVKSILTAALLFIGVLMGMQLAGNGMKNLQGYDNPDMKSAFTVKNGGQNQDIEASVLGQSITSHDLETKRKQLESMEAFNPLSEAAKGISSGIENLFGKLISAVKGEKDQ
ncbi:DUF3679 domain-containing protein [Bacillus sp. SJS]|uniref:DUF3679 domain-containing protein n=1 Tax=Bacillus sp. SJS TaxID=1423321 RepID=UPI0004DCCA98|nr:DUF3679 domain-containing protein [Bacillus sp. SJS]KZZ85992.1 hypothetical protein AS29_002085 [Bacillus sp. SJS]